MPVIRISSQDPAEGENRQATYFEASKVMNKQTKEVLNALFHKKHLVFSIP